MGRISEAKKARLHFLTAPIFRHWRLAALSFGFNAVSALFEGNTMALLAVALSTLAGTIGGVGGEDAGTLGKLAESFQNQLGIGANGLFLLFVALAVVSQVMKSAFQFAGQASAIVLSTMVQGETRDRVFRQAMSLSYPQVSKYHSGDLIAYCDQSSQLGAFVTRLNHMTLAVLTMLVYLGTLFWLSWPMSIVAICTLLILSLALRGVVGRISDIAGRRIRFAVEMSKRTIENLQAMRLLHTFARQRQATRDVAEVVNQTLMASRAGAMWQYSIQPMIEVATVVSIAAFLVGGYLLLRGDTADVFPRLLTFLVVLYRFMPRITTLNNNRAQIANGMPAIDRVQQFLRSDDKEVMLDVGKPFPGLRDQIEFRDVTLRYIEGEHPALQDVSFCIPKGEMVALVGESGAGKSSAADLLLRLFNPTRGEILVDSEDLRQFNVTTWRNRLGVVSQDTFVFNMSIGENIAFGRPDATPDEVVAAAKAAHADQFIQALESGYETIVGDRGYRLSGGQRQRVAIARAILRDPDILIFDEATSALDSQSELQVQQAINELRTSRTVLIIAHRLSTIAGADQVVVLDHGRVVEQGSPADLMSRNGHYAHLWRLQADSDYRLTAMTAEQPYAS